MRRILIATLMMFAVVLPLHGYAQTPEQLQSAIGEHNKQIEALNKEIAQYQAQLDATSAKKQTLQTKLSEINLSIRKVSASVNLIKNKIGTTQLEIQQLESGIATKADSISRGEAGLAESIRRLHEVESQSLAVQMLASHSASDIWEDADLQQSIQDAVRARINTLSEQKRVLADTKSEREKKKSELQDKQRDLVTEQGSLTATKKAQNDILSQTKSQEATYQKILAEKKAQQRSFEDALLDLQAQLNVTISQSEITAAGKGIIRWPVDKVRVTQYFGNTAFAASGAYKGKGHNGIDLGVPIGTPLKAALSGEVAGTGNTDSVRGCYSFGKWVLIRHSNGLATLYAHLSQIGVSQGETVATGQVIGYSGETGYATGPHLHFGVYVSSATKVMRLGEATKSTTPCSGATMPIAPTEAYLNPLNYL